MPSEFPNNMPGDGPGEQPCEPPCELPEAMRDKAKQYLARFADSAPADVSVWLDEQLSDDEFARQLYRVWAGSEFVALNCIRHPGIFQQLVNSGDLFISYDDSTLHNRCVEALTDDTDNSDNDNSDNDNSGAIAGNNAGKNSERETILHLQLRHFRRYEMLRIIWRDLAWRDLPRVADMVETTGDMSRLADAVIQVSLDKLHNWLSDTWGSPVGESSGLVQSMLVLGMGKLGADELNVSSDIDLIFAYTEAGETQGADKQLTNQEFFIRLGQKLIQALDNQTAEGQVFRVDMRLRPYGNSGALVLSFDALEEYYQTQGRDWERYAMIKSRVIGGEQQAARALMEMLRAFTYRRYTDFSAIQSLRDMKAMINLEVQRRNLAGNIKLGHGGIREIEFIAQAFQLIRGGRDSRFQNRRLRNILLLLDVEDLLPEKGGEKLWQAYVFLRNLEHVLQGWRDQQTQQLPDDRQENEQERLRVAVMMGFTTWPSFIEVLDRHRTIVKELFDGLVADVHEGSSQDEDERGGARAWSESDKAELQGQLEDLGYDDAELAAERLYRLRDSRAVSAMQADTRSRLDKLMPEVINTCADAANSTQALVRVLPLIESVARRSTYLVLLIENEAALQQLVNLCAASPWISQSLSRHPVLLDELLDVRTLYAPPDRQQLGDELRQQLLRIPEDDLEAQMETLRYFRLAHGLRVAACEVMGILPLMKVSDYLTWLAEVILEEVLALAWQNLTIKHGPPADSNGRPPGFLIIGYGKLGGIELGHGSDLDLVFLHNADTNLMTTGERSIGNETFFARLGQRVIHILNTATPAGVLYEVDMRLRPSGNSGLLVSSISAFEKYQQDSAWTWEHQALVRARAIAGDEGLASEFAQLRHSILVRERDIETLKHEVGDMRQKMAQNLGLDKQAKQAGRFHLKQDPGGIVDIEFMVQFTVLAQAHRFPRLTQWSDNIRTMTLLSECGVLNEQENQQLTEAYIAYRSAGHQLQLQEEVNVVETEQFAAQRHIVLTIWQKFFGDSDATKLTTRSE